MVDHYVLLAWVFNAVLILGILNALGLAYLIYLLRKVTTEEGEDDDE